ncbi:hypothetical protein XU18_2284 [Perkinsela sp. CCAP 1560/4]|nr:hypothetical protein XU18_2284 [Perkinsela sp. CCAP 1560/4]|eukprot:KNH07013.1 hypothetical protein XU18_2284 [Perkinsela sp. CCAP 1560/4]
MEMAFCISTGLKEIHPFEEDAEVDKRRSRASQSIQRLLNRWKSTSSWWVGPVPRRGEAKGPPKLSSCFCFGADPIDGRRKVVGLDQYPIAGRFRKPQIIPMGDPGPLGETRERLLIVCGTKRRTKLAHMKSAEKRGHVHTCRKAHANCTLKNKTKNHCRKRLRKRLYAQ